MSKRNRKWLGLIVTGAFVLQAAGCTAVFGDAIAQILFSTVLQQIATALLGGLAFL